MIGGADFKRDDAGYTHSCVINPCNINAMCCSGIMEGLQTAQRSGIPCLSSYQHTAYIATAVLVVSAHDLQLHFSAYATQR
jgi:hypothetical protein